MKVENIKSYVYILCNKNKNVFYVGSTTDLKKRGMGKSKMRSDLMVKLEGQRSSMSLNMTRLIKDLEESEEKMRGDPSSLRSFGIRGW